MSTNSLNKIAIVAAGLLCLNLTACATYRGMGPLVTNGENAEVAEGSVVPQGGRLTWNGEKTVQEPERSVRFDWPVDDAKMSRGFLAAKRRPHWGLDLANKRGTPIMSAEHGTVIYTGNAFKGYGKLVVIEHNDEWATLYSHLDKILVKEGQVVAKGDLIAQMGRTGRATGNHLHFEVRHYRMPVNPLAYLPQNPSLNDLAHLPGAGSLLHLRQLPQQSNLSKPE